MNDCLKIFQNMVLFVLVFFIVLLNNNIAQDKLKSFYRLGMSKELLEDVNVKDAKAVLDIWTEILKENFKDVDKISVTVFNNANELVGAISKKEVDIIYTSGVIFKEYNLDKKYDIEPIVILNTGNKRNFDLYFLTNSKNKISKFADLKGKTIMIQGGKFKFINELWLDLLCLQNGENDKYKFFKKVEFTEKPMQSILPVFFEKADFCIISSISYFAIKELNPQISKALYKIYERKNLVNEVICLPKSFTKAEKKIIHNASINYENLPNIKQLGKILKSLGSYTYSDSSFAGTSELWNDYQKLKNEK